MQPNSFDPQQPQDSTQLPGASISPTIVSPTTNDVPPAPITPATPSYQEPAVTSSQAPENAWQQPAAPDPTPMMSPSQLAEQALPPAPSPMSSEKGHPVLKTVGSLVVLAVVFAGGYFANLGVTNASQSNATKQAKAFISALNAGDNSKAYAMASSQLHGQQTESQFSSALGDVKASQPNLDNQTVAFSGRNVAVYTAVEDGLPQTTDGATTGTFTVALVKDGLTGWKVDSVNIE